MPRAGHPHGKEKPFFLLRIRLCTATRSNKNRFHWYASPAEPPRRQAKLPAASAQPPWHRRSIHPCLVPPIPGPCHGVPDGKHPGAMLPDWAAFPPLRSKFRRSLAAGALCKGKLPYDSAARAKNTAAWEGIAEGDNLAKGCPSGQPIPGTGRFQSRQHTKTPIFPPNPPASQHIPSHSRQHVTKRRLTGPMHPSASRIEQRDSPSHMPLERRQSARRMGSPHKTTGDREGSASQSIESSAKRCASARTKSAVSYRSPSSITHDGECR